MQLKIYQIQRNANKKNEFCGTSGTKLGISTNITKDCFTQSYGAAKNDVYISVALLISK